MTVKQKKEKNHLLILAIVFAVAAALLFFVWLKDHFHTRFISILLAGLSLAGVAFLGVQCLRREEGFSAGESGTRKDRLIVLGMVLVSRILLYLLGF